MAAVALGLAIFRNSEIALVMGIGALIPDLDREYFFVAKSFIGRHQLHRALFHNFLFMAILYAFVNPFLCFGALSHSLLDMFTSATDRGAEVFFPFTRVIKKYNYTVEGEEKQDPASAKKFAEWWVEDPWSLLKKTSDRDLQEPEEQPWRRSYGPFKNDRVVDWGVFFASLVFLVIASLALGSSFYFMLGGFREFSLVPLAGIAIFYGLGEWWRRKLVNEKVSEKIASVVLGFLVLGLVVFVIGATSLYSPPQIPALGILGYAFASLLIGLGISYLFVRFRKKYPDLSL